MIILMMMMMMTVQKTSCHEVSVCKLNLRIDKLTVKLVNVTVTSRNTVRTVSIRNLRKFTRRLYTSAV